jgi:hypothetical protein
VLEVKCDELVLYYSSPHTRTSTAHTQAPYSDISGGHSRPQHSFIGGSKQGIPWHGEGLTEWSTS